MQACDRTHVSLTATCCVATTRRRHRSWTTRSPALHRDHPVSRPGPRIGKSRLDCIATGRSRPRDASRSRGYLLAAHSDVRPRGGPSGFACGRNDRPHFRPVTALGASRRNALDGAVRDRAVIYNPASKRRASGVAAKALRCSVIDCLATAFDCAVISPLRLTEVRL